MVDYKIILGIVASILSVVSYVPYIRDILKGKTKPHFFSWFIWSLLLAIGFSAQLVKGAGIGAWAVGFTAASCFTIAILAIFKGEKDIKNSDWLTFLGALGALILWQLTHNPLTAVILVIITDALAFSITFRKAYYKPDQETISSYFLSAIGLAISLFALQSYNLTTWLYPVALVTMDGSFSIMTYTRRRTLNKRRKI